MRLRIKALAVFFLLFSLALSAQSLRGRVIEKGSEKPIPFAYVIVPDTSLVAETGLDGSFELELPEGLIPSIRVVSETHQALDLKLESIPSEPLLIELAALSVELDKVEVVGEREVLKTSRSIDRADVQNTATGGDPFALVERAPDVVKPTDPALGNDMYSARNELSNAMSVPVLLLTNPFNYRGLPAYSNAYFMSRGLPLFFQYYTFTGAMISSIVPSDVLGGMEMYGNGRDPSLGPGNGLLSSFSIAEPEEKKVSMTLYLSALAAGLVMEIPIYQDKAGITFSLRKSLYELTWIPLALELNRTFAIFPIMGVGDDLTLNFSIFPGNVDAYAKLFWEPMEGSRLSLDIMDATGYTTLIYETYSRYNDYTNFIYSDVVHQSGGLLSWDSNLGEKLQYKAQLHENFSLLWKRNATVMLGGEETAATYAYPLNDLGGNLEAEYLAHEDLLLSAGLSGRWIKGGYDRELKTDAGFNTLLPILTPNLVLHKTTLDTWELSGYTKASWTIGDFELEPALRLDYFPIIESPLWYTQLRGSPTLQAFWYPASGHSLHLGGGMRYDRFDYFTRQTFLSEKGIAINPGGLEFIDENYIQRYPSRLFTVEADYAWKGRNRDFRAGGYFNYVDQLSGFDYQTYVAESNLDIFSLIAGSLGVNSNAGLKTTQALWSLGANLDYRMDFRSGSLDFLYNLGVVRFKADIEENGNYAWVIPRSDVSHNLKIFGHWEPNKCWDLDGTLKILLGIPASRHKVESVYYDELQKKNFISYSTIENSIFEFRDYMPRFTFDFKVVFKTDTWPSMELFADIANLISFPRYLQPNSTTLGFEEQTTLDREYSWEPIYWGNLLQMKLDIGCRFKL